MKHANPLRPIDLSWPFAICEIDIMGILPKAPRDFRFLFIAIDILTKWMKAMLVANITQETVAKFLQSIIYRFDVPRMVLIDNGTELSSKERSL
jgi:hypothetical protein